MWPELTFISPHKIDHFLAWNITLKVNKIMPNILSLYNSSQENKFKKIFLTLIPTLDELFNDTPHIPLKWIYRLAKIDWTKNPFEYVAPPTHKWGRNNKTPGLKCKNGKPENCWQNCCKHYDAEVYPNRHGHIGPMRVSRVRFYYVNTLKLKQYFGK